MGYDGGSTSRYAARMPVARLSCLSIRVMAV